SLVSLVCMMGLFVEKPVDVVAAVVIDVDLPVPEHFPDGQFAGTVAAWIQSEMIEIGCLVGPKRVGGHEIVHAAQDGALGAALAAPLFGVEIPIRDEERGGRVGKRLRDASTAAAAGWIRIAGHLRVPGARPEPEPD